MASGILDIVESAYDVGAGGQEWLARLNERFASRFPNVVAWGGHVISKTEQGPPRFHHAVLTEVEDAMTVFGPMHTNMDPAFAEAIFPTGTQCALFSEHWERVRGQRSWDAGTLEVVRGLQDYLRLRGGDDLLFCYSYDRTGTGVLLAGIVNGKTRLGHRVRHIHRRAAVHVAAGMRMRHALATAPLEDRSEAVFEADGRLAHATGRAAYGDTRARLRDAVRRVDRARTDAVRREEIEALDLWQGLVEGRWSLIDRYDTDGRRYYVAVANPPEGVDARQLTGAEAQVTAQVVAGEPNGIIAYSLGVTESTIAGHLRNAMRKLGARSRMELIRVARVRSAPEPSQPSLPWPRLPRSVTLDAGGAMPVDTRASSLVKRPVSHSEMPEQPRTTRATKLRIDDVELAVFGLPAPAAPRSLTEAEREVAELSLEGLSNREIAERRGVSVKTIANQLRRIYQKLGVNSRFELATQLDG